MHIIKAHFKNGKKNYHHFRIWNNLKCRNSILVSFTQPFHHLRAGVSSSRSKFILPLFIASNHQLVGFFMYIFTLESIPLYGGCSSIIIVFLSSWPKEPKVRYIGVQRAHILPSANRVRHWAILYSINFWHRYQNDFIRRLWDPNRRKR